jgi:hypothetical protein
MFGFVTNFNRFIFGFVTKIFDFMFEFITKGIVKAQTINHFQKKTLFKAFFQDKSKI